MIAMALICQPKVLIADEPTTALDVTIQAQIIDLVKRLRDEIGMAIIWITHDLGMVAGLADRVNVMYAGFIIEEAAGKRAVHEPAPPLHHGAAAAVLPRLDVGRRAPGAHRRLSARALREPAGLPLCPRCQYPMAHCIHENPPLVEVGPGHGMACWVKTRPGKRARRRTPYGGRSPAGALLRVENLVKHFPITRGSSSSAVGRSTPWTASPSTSTGRDPRAGGRVGLRQVHHRAHDPAALPADPGPVYFEGEDLTRLSRKELRPMRRTCR